MTDKQREIKLIKLQDKLSSLEYKLFLAEREESAKLERRGWGYGMRHSKIGFSTRKSDNLKKRIEICKQKIAELCAEKLMEN